VVQYRTLGRTGLSVSEIGFGGAPAGIRNYLGRWDPSDAASRQSVIAALHRALDLGLNYLDTAPSYGDGASEAIMGEVVAARRDECIVATKCGSHVPSEIRASCEASLRRLRTDVIDVFQFHGGWYDPPDVGAILDGGGLDALRQLREEGKIRFLGFTAEAPTGGLSQLIATGEFDVLQIRYNLLYQHAYDTINNRGAMFEAEEQRMGIVIMRPATSGIFPRLMRAAWPEIDRHLDLHKLALSYVLSNPLVDVAIVGMRRAEEVESNSAISDDLAGRLDLAEINRRFVE
jgi:aryl-alcohol dehydrogenase-like predicted oxidoreductase